MGGGGADKTGTIDYCVTEGFLCSPNSHPQNFQDDNLVSLLLNSGQKMWSSETPLGKKNRKNRAKANRGSGGVGEMFSSNENRNVTREAEPPILSYCLNIPHSPIMRFSIKIEISTEFCLWKHNSEKAHVQIETQAERGTTYPSLIDNHPQLCIFHQLDSRYSR